MNRLKNKIRQITDKIISCEENNKKLKFYCKGRIFCLIHLDNVSTNSILNNNQVRCDYIIVSEELNNKKEEIKNIDIALWIELKGNNTKHALEQIEQSIKEFGNIVTNKYIAIVCSKVYPQFDTYKRRFQKRYKKVKFFQPKTRELELEYNPSNQDIFVCK